MIVEYIANKVELVLSGPSYMFTLPAKTKRCLLTREREHALTIHT